MLRTVYTPENNFINVSIPDKYVGMELEISVIPINEVSNDEKKTQNIDLSFGGWADTSEFIPEKTAEEIITELRASRKFGGRIIEPFD